ncbi:MULTISPECIES: EF-P beta-lysylation protein EpmB [unclassified Pseudoalteromonas]|uniref:EF-P beta-lysylation protein EpmB n=1 Tax=unclassified Pseudoalteromonas TaxID=194690 RepID=UPI002097236F|nr:EF-P beta-lysylation protein EpmB [Pseudoalteromonas sp. XMcav2-N]MCO7188637.1 EF-P beta-lysylation protein EpmB [Pseudoalteromonas sp. XMcav2-N]
MIQINEVNLHTNWQKELANVVTSADELLKLVGLEGHFSEQDLAAKRLFPLRVPRPFIAKMRYGDAQDPLLLQVLPQHQEFLAKTGFNKDPLDEQQAALPGLLHKYRSRVLLMLKTGCAVNCRYCFRRHFPYQDNQLNKRTLHTVFDYLKAHPEINEVILSGGDPLMAKDDMLAWLLEHLEAIPHLRRLRVHTRLPVVIPARITDSLCDILSHSRLKPVLVNHINHANEIDVHFSVAMQKLKRAGVMLLNQAVLLKGINDSLIAQQALSEALFDADIIPYYLHLLDKVEGASHFDVTEQEAITLMHGLLDALPGFLVPKLVREIGGQPSKTPIDLGLSPT